MTSFVSNFVSPNVTHYVLRVTYYALSVCSEVAEGSAGVVSSAAPEDATGAGMGVAGVVSSAASEGVGGAAVGAAGAAGLRFADQL